MVEKGRGIKVPRKVKLKLLKLYCERGAVTPWMFSIEEVADICGVDRRKAVAIIREAAVPLIERDLQAGKQ